MRIEDQLSSAFPGLAVVEARVGNLHVREREEALEGFKKQVLGRIRQSVASLEEVRDKPVFRAYRDFFWRVGIDPTKTRPAGEALARRVIAGKELPTINTLVDSYNLASLETSIAVAAFDTSAISPDALLMRKARAGEKFLGIGMDSAIVLRGIEVVIEDQARERLIAVYPYRDSDESKVTLSTREVLLLMCGVPGIEPSTLEHAQSVTEEYVKRFCLS